MRAHDDERGMMPSDERWYDRARVGLAAVKQWRRDRLSRRLRSVGRVLSTGGLSLVWRAPESPKEATVEHLPRGTSISFDDDGGWESEQREQPQNETGVES